MVAAEEYQHFFFVVAAQNLADLTESLARNNDFYIMVRIF